MGKDLKGRELGKCIVQKKDGRYCVRIQCKGIKKTANFHSLKEAKAFAIEQQYKNQTGTFASENMLFSAWFTYWIDEIKGNRLAYRTQESYRYLYKSFIQPVLGNLTLDKIKPIHCQHVLKTMEKKGLADSGIKKTRTIMKDCLESAVENRIISFNPVSRSVNAKGAPTKERYVLSKREQEAFLEEAKKCVHYEVYAFVLATGLRYGELCGLKWEDVNFRKRTISVKRTLLYRPDLKRFVEKEPKSKAGYRTIPLTDGAMDILKSIYARELPIVLGYQNYIFRNSCGKPAQKSEYNKALKVIMKNLQLPPISMHNLRHTFATRCIEAGMRPKTLQRILGHASLAMTMDLYVHVTDEELISEFDKIKDAIVI